MSYNHSFLKLVSIFAKTESLIYPIVYRCYHGENNRAHKKRCAKKRVAA